MADGQYLGFWSADMNIAVLGLWHLGSVYAAGAAAAGHSVTGWDHDPAAVESLASGKPPVSEPDLTEQIGAGLKNGSLRFTQDLSAAVSGADVVWITYDTPVDELDRADCAFVTSKVVDALPLLKSGAVILVSSQLPVGSVRELEEKAAILGRADLEFACSPENLRLGKAVKLFAAPDRVICGIRTAQGKEILERLWRPITERVEWMGVESAEMVKHAINAFLATSVAFGNEIAVLCEAMGADAKEVERGLKSESRIGPGAYVGPGLAFAGGTLARDIAFLSSTSGREDQRPILIPAVRASNDRHKHWPLDKLKSLFNVLDEKTFALWGLAYKPGTDTLRRSSALELACSLLEAGARVRAHDPAVRVLPEEFDGRMELSPSALAAADGADAVVVCTPWEDYRAVKAKDLASVMRRPLVIDPARFLFGSLGRKDGIIYEAIGLASQQSR
jgi:UDPglucose 6-dehydrogenase